jgi:hypothetical protein
MIDHFCVLLVGDDVYVGLDTSIDNCRIEKEYGHSGRDE